MHTRIFIHAGLALIAAIALCAAFAGCDQATAPPAQAATPKAKAPPRVERVHRAPTIEERKAEVVKPAAPIAALAEQPETQSTTTAATAATGTVEVTNANVEAIDTVELPAQEAGVIRELDVAEGDTVSEGGSVGQIDDDRAQIELQLARIERETSKEQAENDVNLQYAIAAEKVAELEHRRAVDANLQSPGAFTQNEVDRLRLVHQRSKFQVDQAKMEMKIAGMTLAANEARVKAAEKSLSRRQIIAPRTGVVVKLYKRAGEWVDPGEAMLKLVRSDRMRVEGYMNAREYDPHTMVGKPVRITVELARGRKVEVDGRVKLPDLTIGANGEYRVWAEVENKKDAGAWLLRPGQRATMTIEVGE